MSGESSFRNVTRSNFDLVVTKTKIDLGENFGSSQLIKKNIDSGKSIFVLDGYCIKRPIINKQPQATIFLFDKHSGTTPRRRARENITLYLTTSRVGISVPLVPWEEYDKVA
jgi:hypothetical protein